jgi:hypothetical protein
MNDKYSSIHKEDNIKAQPFQFVKNQLLIESAQSPTVKIEENNLKSDNQPQASALD